MFYGIDPEVITQIFRQIFYFISASSLNNLLLRKELCHWSKGSQIRHNLSHLELWMKEKQLAGDVSIYKVALNQFLANRVLYLCSGKVYNGSAAADPAGRLPPSSPQGGRRRRGPRLWNVHVADRATNTEDIEFIHATGRLRTEGSDFVHTESANKTAGDKEFSSTTGLYHFHYLV